MKKNKSIIFILCFLLSFIAKSQENNSKLDTVYYVSISGRLENGRPVFTQLLIKDIDTLKILINQKNFMCNIFNSSIFVSEPYSGFLEMSKFLGNDTKKEFVDFNKKIKSFNEKIKEVVSIPDNHYQKLHISIIKTISEFWILPIDYNKLNEMSESIKIQPECYKSKYYYKFKKIIDIIPLTKKERKSYHYLNIK